MFDQVGSVGWLTLMDHHGQINCLTGVFLVPGSTKDLSTSQQALRSNQWTRVKYNVLAALDDARVGWVLMVMTLFVIFQEDFKYAVLPPGADVGIESITLALLMIFIAEIGNSSAGGCGTSTAWRTVMALFSSSTLMLVLFWQYATHCSKLN